jgi:CheY-like chemotaxis protein
MTEHKSKHVILVEEAMSHLLRQNEWQDPMKFPVPGLILLDINLPKKNGLEVLQEMQQNPALKDLLTVVLTSSANKANIVTAYDFGANSYIQKPSQINQFTNGLHLIMKYWFQFVEYPFRAVRD